VTADAEKEGKKCMEEDGLIYLNLFSSSSSIIRRSKVLGSKDLMFLK